MQENANTSFALHYRVRTLTGKEIELDIEPDYKVFAYHDFPAWTTGTTDRALLHTATPIRL